MDGILVKKAKKGNKKALVRLIVNRQDDFYGLAYSYMKNEEDAMNMVQDMVIKLYENISKLRDNKSFYTYSKTILVNLCKDELKLKSRLIPVEEIYGQGTYEDENSLLVEEILSKLDDKHRQVIHLKYIMDYDYESIGKILDLPLGTVKSRIHNGMKKLKEEYCVR